MDFLKGKISARDFFLYLRGQVLVILIILGFGVIYWLILKWSEDLCLDGGTYCQQKYCGKPEMIKACEQESIDKWNKLSAEEKASVQKIIEYGKDKK